ncbi:hypothetical protein RFI_18664 [Reticulomyxa filosa]|uniref:Uncharacterized protein n=1 Tax=Reticulomyxa filosa TaxID=46433 RepID=X6MXP1_RETFI|nr:hypothetical protein RFI_18664 [Reticulomyxa filosa]|eukprot:ETO18601.1 hypothetical protein RFI_18664 [Reticulomyxa filosa]
MTASVENVRPIKDMEEDYLQQCQRYQSKVDCGVVVLSRFYNEIKSYKPSIILTDNDLIPIVNVLIKYEIVGITCYNFSNCQLTSNGIYLLYDLCMKYKDYIEKLELRNNSLGDEGAFVLAKILVIPSSKLKFLGLHWNKCVCVYYLKQTIYKREK